jgi:tetratricopeptide (TPR) repeat protein
MLRRGAMLDAAGRFDDALALADRASRVAGESGLLAQELRAGFLRGSALVGAGRFADAEAAARANVDKALAAGLQGVAADGLIDMAGALLVSDRLNEADQVLVRAGTIAEERSLTRTAMRAATQRAALKLQNDQPREALALLGPPLKYFADTHHQRLEAVALTIGSRAHENLGELTEARTMAQRVYEFAAASGNVEITAQALVSLADLAGAEGNLPQAAAHYAAAIDRLRELGDSEALPFELANQASLLVRLGRRPDAEVVLAELDAGIASGAGTFPTRARQVGILRALAALIDQRFADARQLALVSEQAAPGRTDQSGQMARAVIAVAEARQGAGTRGAVPQLEPGVGAVSSAGMEIRLWRAEVLLARGQAAEAGNEAAAVLRESPRSGGRELGWRAAAVSARAADRRRDSAAAALAAQALDTLDTVGRDWGPDPTSLYRARPDLMETVKELHRISSTRP